MLALLAWRITRYALTRCAQTDAPSQWLKRAARAASRAALLGASQAHRVLPGPGFAAALVVLDPKTTAATTSRQAAPGRGDFCGDEERSTGVGARQRAS